MKADISHLTSLFTWWWAPSFGSQLLLNFLYSSHFLTPPSSPRLRNNHLQLSRTFLILLTLLYQLYTSIATASSNYYQLLGLPLDIDAEGVKRSFRSLARRYHPDKVGESGASFFIILRSAHDALSDPVKRFAYDRFGPTIADWKDCDSSRDYMRRGLMGLVAFYTINPAMYALFGWLNSRADGISFWRLATLFSLLSFELSLLVSPVPPLWLSIILPNTTIYDLRNLLHGLFVNFFFASLQLSAALDVLEYGEAGAPARDKASKALLAERQLEVVKVKAETLSRVADVVNKNVLAGLAREVRPFRGKEEKEGAMSEEEERLFERVDAVLLARSLVQQNPQLARLAEVKREEGAQPLSEEEEGVKKEEGEQGSASEEPKVRHVKQEDVAQSIRSEEPHEGRVKQEEVNHLTSDDSQAQSILSDAPQAFTVKEEAVEPSIADHAAWNADEPTAAVVAESHDNKQEVVQEKTAVETEPDETLADETLAKVAAPSESASSQTSLAESIANDQWVHLDGTSAQSQSHSKGDEKGIVKDDAPVRLAQTADGPPPSNVEPNAMQQEVMDSQA